MQIPMTIWEKFGLSIRRGLPVFLGAAIVFLSSAVPGQSPSVTEASANAQEAAKPTITIDLGKTKGKISPNAFGITIANRGHDAPELSHFFRTPEGKLALMDLGVRTVNYGADRDNWAQPYNPFTAVPETYPSLMDTTEFLNVNQTLGSDPMIAVNITHLCRPADENQPPSTENVTCEMATPQLAKDWLAFIKQSGIRQVKYVQLGAEPYAGCQYWLPSKDINCTVGYGEHKIALTQDEYAKRVLKWATALRQVDPKIKLGIHLLPNAFLCKNGCDGTSWDETLLKKVGPKIDFVITHQYFEIDNAPVTEGEAQRLSYYQEQRDVRLSKNGVTAMPRQIRKELSKWLPTKKDIPIVVGEYNASRSDADDPTVVEIRMSLYGSMAIAEGYLDMLLPVRLKGTTLPGAQRLLFLDLQTLPVMISHYLPQDDPQTLVLSPAWHMFAMLKDWQGKTMLSPRVEGNTKTSFDRPTLRVYAVKQGRDVWLAVFNHDITGSRTLDVALIGAKPLTVTATVIGDTATSLLTHNSAVNPNAIAPSTWTVDPGQIKTDRIAGMVFPAHSLTVLHIEGE